MPIRFGIQTILWGHDPGDYGRMFDVIEDAGFEGVEFFQQPENLPQLVDLLELLSKRRRPLTLLGLSGGSLDKRVQYLNQPLPPNRTPSGWNPKAPYLYIDEWETTVDDLLLQKYRLAVHPHYLKQIDSAKDAFERLNKNPGLLYIPDTAHSAIKRENIKEGITRYSGRLAAIHLKDWRPGFGRVSAFYARGFTELGNGTVELEQVLQLLNNIHYDGWIVVEQDYTEGIVEKSLQDAASWLTRHKNLTGFDRVPSLTAKPLAQLQLEADGGRITLETIHKFTSQRFASLDVGLLYQRIAEALCESLKLTAAAIWSCSELERILTLQGFAPLPNPEGPELTVACEEIAGPLEAKAQLTSEAHPTIRKAIENIKGPANYFRLPVRSTWNPHHTRMIVDLFCDDLDPKPRSVMLLSQSIARVLDSHIDRIAFSSAADLNLAATLATDEEDFGKRLKTLCLARLKCEAVALFLADASGTRLKPFVTPELTWRADLHPSERYYEAGDGQLTTQVWLSREPHFQNRRSSSSTPKTSKCVLERKHADEDRVLAMPIVDTQGRAIGLVRCVNKLTMAGNIGNFSDDAPVILDHILQQAIPTLRLRNAAEEERRRVLIVAHELKRPVSALCGVIDFMMADVENEKERTRLLPKTRHQILDASRWSENLRSLVMRSRYLTGRADKQFTVARQPTELMGEIVASTIAQLRHELREKGLPQKGMTYDNFRAIPTLFLDRNMFQQIFFNLLDNAIKYAGNDKSKFSVTITSGDDGRHYTITITDNGKGIPADMADNLFQLGARGPAAFSSAEGAGVGLWLVRQLVELHGGVIKVTSYSRPTSLKIELPHKLATENWKL